MGTTPFNPYVYLSGTFVAEFSAESKYFASNIAVSHFGSLQTSEL